MPGPCVDGGSGTAVLRAARELHARLPAPARCDDGLEGRRAADERGAATRPRTGPSAPLPSSARPRPPRPGALRVLRASGPLRRGEKVPPRAAWRAEGLLPASKSRHSTLERASTSPALPRPFSSLADALSWFLTSRYLHCERRASRRAARSALSSLHVSAPGCARPSAHAESLCELALSLAPGAGRRAHPPVVRGLALLAGIQLPPAR